uniref:Cation-transporting ATPase n=1 Tax=Magallana gigas TaxID=29159 RepID=K1Q4N6_MAGGI
MTESERGEYHQVKMKAGLDTSLRQDVLYLNKGTDDQMEITGYRPNRMKRWGMYVGYLLTAGILPLVMYWCPHWYIKCTHTQTKLADATKVLLKDQYEQWFVAEIILVTKDGTSNWKTRQMFEMKSKLIHN